MRTDSFSAQVLGNLARTSPPFPPEPAHEPARAPRARPFRSWLMHALAFAPVSDDTAHQDEMRVSARSADRSAPPYAQTTHAKRRAPATQPSERGTSVPPAPAEMIARARHALESAPAWESPLQQYAAIHHAALYAASAVLAVRKRPEHKLGRRSRTRKAWDVLPEVAPDLSEFATYFDKTTIKSVRAEAGIPGAIDTHELEDLRLMATQFMRQVEALEDVKRATRAQTGDEGGATTMRRTS